LTKPGIKRQWPSRQIAVELTGRVGERLLHNVGGVDPGRQPRVGPDGNHAFEPAAVPVQQLAAGRCIPGRRLPQQVISVGVGRGSPHKPNPETGGEILQFFSAIIIFSVK
jgi:hypothetical protein